MTITNGVAATEPFTATLTAKDGTTTDVTADTMFAIDDGLGSFAANTLSMTEAGKTLVTGTYLDANGTAEVIGHAKSVRVDPTLPPNAPDLFGGADDPTHAPAIVYPPQNTVMPRNIGDFEVHWTDLAGNDIFEVSLHTTYSDVDVYTPISSPANFSAFTPGRVGDQRSATTTPSSSRSGGVQSANPDDGRQLAAADGHAVQRGHARRSLLLGDRVGDRRLRHLPPRHEQAR